METVTPIKKPYGHVRDVVRDSSEFYDTEYRIIGPEGAVSWRQWRSGRADRVYSHSKKQRNSDEWGPSNCDILGGHCWGIGSGVLGNRAQMALETSIEALWAYLEECYVICLKQLEEERVYV